MEVSFFNLQSFPNQNYENMIASLINESFEFFDLAFFEVILLKLWRNFIFLTLVIFEGFQYKFRLDHLSHFRMVIFSIPVHKKQLPIAKSQFQKSRIFS